MSGSEVFDDVAFYYVATTFVGSAAFIGSLVVGSDVISSLCSSRSKKQPQQIKSDNNGVAIVDSAGFIEEKLRAKNVIKTPTFREKYFKKRYAFLLLAWILFFWLFSFRTSMSGKNFVTFEPYDILELSYGAKEQDIRKQYRRLSMRYHPDLHPGDQSAADHFLLITKAYNALTDPKARANMERYGNPDGQTPQSMTYGLPTILSDKKYEIYVLVCYLALFISIPLYVVSKVFVDSPTLQDTGVLKESVGWMLSEMRPDMEAKQVIEIICLSMEFRKRFSKQSSDKIQFITDTFPRLKGVAPHKHNKIFYVLYSSVLLHAYLQRQTIPINLQSDLHFVLQKAPLLLRVILQFSRHNRSYKQFMNTIRLLQCCYQGLWVDAASPLLQLPHITSQHVILLSKKHINSLQDFRLMPRQECIELLGIDAPTYDEIAASASIIPCVSLQTQLDIPNCTTAQPQDVIQIKTTIIREMIVNAETMQKRKQLQATVVRFPDTNASTTTTSTTTSTTAITNVAQTSSSTKSSTQSLISAENAAYQQLEQRRAEVMNKIENWEVYRPSEKKAPVDLRDVPYVLSQTYPFEEPVRETWYVLLIWYHNNQEHLIDSRCIKSFSANDTEFQCSPMYVQLPQTVGVAKYELRVLCENYGGCTFTRKIEVQIVPALTKKQLKQQAAAAAAAATALANSDGDIVDETKSDTAAAAATADTADDDEDDDDEEEIFDDIDFEQPEAPAYWYYLGGSSFIEGLLNLIVLIIIGIVGYVYLHKLPFWKRHIDPIIEKIQIIVLPHVNHMYSYIEPYVNISSEWLHWALDWFLGDTSNMPTEIKISKAYHARSRFF